MRMTFVCDFSSRAQKVVFVAKLSHNDETFFVTFILTWWQFLMRLQINQGPVWFIFTRNESTQLIWPWCRIGLARCWAAPYDLWKHLPISPILSPKYGIFEYPSIKWVSYWTHILKHICSTYLNKRFIVWFSLLVDQSNENAELVLLLLAMNIGTIIWIDLVQNLNNSFKSRIETSRQS